MTSQLYERVDKWTHEPRSILNHKKHFSAAFTLFFCNFSFYLIRKYQKYIYFLQSYTKSKNNFLLQY
jgi:hypothetical protein